MKRANGTGSANKLSCNRRKPYVAKVTIGWSEEGRQQYKCLGYFRAKREALNILEEYNENSYNWDLRDFTFEEVCAKWSDRYYKNVSNIAIVKHKNSFNRYCKSLHKRLI